MKTLYSPIVVCCRKMCLWYRKYIVLFLFSIHFFQFYFFLCSDSIFYELFNIFFCFNWYDNAHWNIHTSKINLCSVQSAVKAPFSQGRNEQAFFLDLWQYQLMKSLCESSNTWTTTFIFITAKLNVNTYSGSVNKDHLQIVH